MTPKLMQTALFPSLGSSLIALTETSDSYLLKVDLPSLPSSFGIGSIYSGKNDLVVESLDSPLISIHTQNGKMRAVYQQGALYILLPKSE